MARLTNQHYLLIHRQLRKAWLEVPHCISWLTPTEQWQLHDFFQPANQLTEVELLAHRRDITKRRPTLPSQAGRALAKLYRIAQTSQLIKQVTPIGHGRHIAVYGLVNPELDLEALAHILVDIATHLDDEPPPEPAHVDDRLAS